MLQHDNVVTENTGRKAYEKPELKSLGDALALTKGGGTVLLDAQGTQLGGGAVS